MVDVGAYLKALNEIAVLGRDLRVIIDCSEKLYRYIELPISLPSIDENTLDKLKEFEKTAKLVRVFREIAKDMGVRKIAKPVVGLDCTLSFNEEPIDYVLIKPVVYHNAWANVAFAELHVENIELPLATYNMSANNVKYRLVNIMQSALFLHMNPWFIDALKHAFARVYGDEEANTLISAVFSFGRIVKTISTSVFV